MKASSRLAAAVLLALAVGIHAIKLPYSADGVTCKDQATLDAEIALSSQAEGVIKSSKEGCQQACLRVKALVAGKDGGTTTKYCERTANYLANIMDVLTTPPNLDSSGNPLPWDSEKKSDAAMWMKFLNEDKNEAANDKANCMHELENHWWNREKFCTPPLTADKYETDGAALNMKNNLSAIRRFAFNMLHKGHKEDGKYVYCLETMHRILWNKKATAFSKDSKCGPILSKKWTGCTDECWKEIETAVKEAGGPKCCLAAYYEEVMAYTYGSGQYDKSHSVLLPSDKVEKILKDGGSCDQNKLPCTSVHDAMSLCGDKAKAYMAEECAHAGASSLSVSLMAVLGAAAAALLAVMH